MYVLWLNSAENIIVRVLKIVVRAITNHIRNNADKLTTMLIYYYFDSISFFLFGIILLTLFSVKAEKILLVVT